MGGAKRSKYNDEALKTIVERLRKLADGLEDVSRSGTAMTDICRRNGWNYVNTRRTLDMILRIDEEPKEIGMDLELLTQIECTPIERLYSELFGIPLGDPTLDTVLTVDPAEQADIWNWLLTGADGSLTPRELIVFRLRYEDGYCYDEISKELMVTRERIRQILAKIQRKLRHPRRANILKCGRGYVSEESMLREEALKERREKFNEELEQLRTQIKPEIISIDEMNLSMRSYNCLYRAGIRTVDGLNNYSVEQLMKVRNLGRKSFKEIITVMRDKYNPDFLAEVNLEAI